MGWAEVRAVKVLLPDFVSEEEGWPSPDDAVFWEVIYPEEVLGLIVDQVPKYAHRYPEVTLALATSYLIRRDAVPPSEEQIAPLLESPDVIYARPPLLAIMSGPILSYLYKMIGIPKGQRNRELGDLIGDPSIGFKDKVSALSPPLKALMWWGLWLGETLNKPAANQPRVVEILTKLDLSPPEII
jgi:hypothetical protein